MTSGHADRYACGPLELELVSDCIQLKEKIADTLRLYNVPWPDSLSPVQVFIHETNAHALFGPGAYLACARMNVDCAPVAGGEVLEATFLSGAIATGEVASGRWDVLVPEGGDEFWNLIDLESLVTLVLTEGWRAAGWVPIHAATVARDGKCALICAESGGGKTSLTAALTRRGWQTLGDDKLLLRTREDGSPELRALVHTFNLHPRTRSWFPEIGDLEQLPAYSSWTEKRKVDPEEIWSGATIAHATPSHLVQLTRNQHGAPVTLAPMTQGEVLSALLHQTVIPSNRATARKILATVATTAASLNGINVDVGEDVYTDERYIKLIEAALS